MGRHSIITKDDVLKAVRLLRWVTWYVLLLFFGGGKKRIKALEKLLPALEREGLLVAQWQKGKKVYSVYRKKKGRPVSVEHEIACSLILVLLWRCRMEEGEIVPERAFRGFGIVPEVGIRYSDERQTMIVIEYETARDFKRSMKSKITRYIKHLPELEKKFKRNISVLFVIDVERHQVLEFVKRMSSQFASANVLDFDGFGERSVGSVADGDASAPYEGDDFFPLNPFFFTDYKTFKSIPIGDALIAKIYFWHDGQEWRLSEND